MDEKKLKNTGIKIRIIGNSISNKVEFARKWTKINNEPYKSTLVSEFGFKIFEYEGKLYRIQLWDLAGQDNNYTLAKIFGKDTDGVVIMTNGASDKSRDDAIQMMKFVDELPPFRDGGKVPVILVENNTELLDSETKEEKSYSIDEFCQVYGFLAGYLASSKNGENVEESMEFLITNIIKRIDIALKKGNFNMNDKKCINLDSKNKENYNCPSGPTPNSKKKSCLNV